MGSVVGPKEALRAFKELLIVLMPTHAFARTESLGDFGSSRKHEAITWNAPGRYAGLDSSVIATATSGEIE